MSTCLVRAWPLKRPTGIQLRGDHAPPKRHPCCLDPSLRCARQYSCHLIGASSKGLHVLRQQLPLDPTLGTPAKSRSVCLVAKRRLSSARSRRADPPGCEDCLTTAGTFQAAVNLGHTTVTLETNLCPVFGFPDHLHPLTMGDVS